MRYIPNATVLIGNGRTIHTDTRGKASIRIRYGKAGKRKAIATATGYQPGITTITVTPNRPR
jgi:hypothetical protein